jgi:cell wall assembly regulator SMI1
MATIKHSGPKVTETDLLRIETRLKSRLPTEYREFLLATNGGRPAPDVIDVPGIPGSEADVQEIFGINRSEKTSCIEWNLTTLVERLEDGLLPIACDSGGSIFCLSLRPGDFGTVLYCDLQSVFGDYESSPDLYVVASSFASFLEKLRPLT